MRAVVLLAMMVAGCSGTSLPAEAVEEGSTPVERPEPVVIGASSYQLGLPSAGPVQTAVGLGVSVPADRTRLLVEVRITLGASIGLRVDGVPGCEHAFPDPQTIAEAPLAYECDSMPGPQTFRLSHGGGRIHFDLRITASPPPRA